MRLRCAKLNPNAPEQAREVLARSPGPEVPARKYRSARLVIRARDRIYADMIRLCRPARDDAILDSGGFRRRQRRCHQAAFVRELFRVAKKVFISVPNRYFPIEHHTAIPLLHYWKPSFELACKRLGKTEWADERNLILMSRQRLLALTPGAAVSTIGHTGIMLGRFSSNLFLFIDGDSPR